MWSCLRPPSSAPVEAFHAADFSPHPHEPRLPRLGSPSDEVTTACDGGAQRTQYELSALGIEPVGVADKSQPARTIGRAPTEVCRVDVVVDRDTHPRECSQVECTSAWSSEIENSGKALLQMKRAHADAVQIMADSKPLVLREFGIDSLREGETRK